MDIKNLNYMAKRRKNTIIDSFDSGILAVELIQALNNAIEIDSNAVVYIRQCEGTDFPPYLSIER